MELLDKFTIKHTGSGGVYKITRDTEGFTCRWDGGKVSYSEKNVRDFLAKNFWTVVPEAVEVKEHNGIKIGDCVVVTDNGKRYDCYSEWANLHGLKNFRWGGTNPSVKNGDKLYVVAIGQHGKRFPSNILFGLENSTGQHFIVGSDGVERVPEVKANGFDAEGKPLNFTADMLELFQRVELRNGEMRIVVPNVQTGYRTKWALVNNQDWVEFDVEKPFEAREWDSVAVYAAPQEINLHTLNPIKKGALIWRAEDPQAKAKQARAEELQRQLVAAANEVAEATGRMEAIKNELQSI